MIKDKRFCMHLSGLTDVYDGFGAFVNVIQKVNILPHERSDGDLKVLDRMAKMKSQILISCHAKCLGTVVCLWKKYHDDQMKLKESGTYQTVSIENDRDTQLYQTRLAVVTEMEDLEKDPVKQGKRKKTEKYSKHDWRRI